MDKISFKMEKLQALNLAMLIGVATAKNRDKFDTNKRYLNAKYSAIELQDFVKDYVTTKEEAEKKRDEFVKPYQQIRKDIEEALAAKTEPTEEEQKEAAESIKMNEKELTEKFEENFKETIETINALAKEEVTVTMNSDKFDVMSDVFYKYGQEKFELNVPGADGRPQVLAFADDALMAADKALSESVKVE
jgi:DNA repair ATPase RecN